MNAPPFRIKALGSEAVLLEWPGAVREEVLMDIMGFSEYLKNHCLEGKSWELVPIYNSLMLCKGASVDMSVLSRSITKWYGEYPGPEPGHSQEWELPVCYESQYGPDLEATANYLGITTETLIRKHTGRAYRVYGIGFLPGFLYLGGVPRDLEIPRRETPRLKVPKGSVGLASQQTGIYPQESPGGWNLIGNCPIPLFDPSRPDPCFISLGDQVRFRSVSAAEYDLHRIEAEVGVYDFKKKYGHAEG